MKWMPPFAGDAQVIDAIPPKGFRPTWIEVDRGILNRNLQRLRQCIPEACAVMAVVKDNAYGHGMAPLARHLEPQVAMLGVAILEEAALLRQAGIHCPLFVLGGLWPGQESQALQLRVTPAVCSVGALERWEAAAASAGSPAGYHLKIDTGMHRLGIMPEQLPDLLRLSSACVHTRLEGLMTHLACADSSDRAFTLRQLASFDACLAAVRAAGCDPRWIHAANSGGILDYPESHYNLVRPGIALYGYDPQPGLPSRGLRPPLTLKSCISLLKEIPAGSAVGYGASFVASRGMRLAAVPIGYGDGYSRSWSNGGRVLIGGHPSPVVGRVSMDTITVDVTNLPQAQAGTEVVLMGRVGDQNIDAQWMSERLGTICYEILTSLSPRLARVYL